MSIFKFKKQNQEYLIPPSKEEEIRKMLKNIQLKPNTFSPPEIILSGINTKRIKRLMWRNARRL